MLGNIFLFYTQNIGMRFNEQTIYNGFKVTPLTRNNFAGA